MATGSNDILWQIDYDRSSGQLETQIAHRRKNPKKFEELFTLWIKPRRDAPSSDSIQAKAVFRPEIHKSMNLYVYVPGKDGEEELFFSLEDLEKGIEEHREKRSNSNAKRRR